MTLDDAEPTATHSRQTKIDFQKHRRMVSDGPTSRNVNAAGNDIELGRWNRSWRTPHENHEHRTFHRLKENVLPSEVRWQEISALAKDPDQPFNPRIQYLEEVCEMGYAAGVPFHIGATEGIVVYMARKTTDKKKLTDPINEDYLTHSSLLIGSAYALRQPRLALQRQRRIESQEVKQRVVAKIRAIRALDRNMKSFVEDEAARKKRQRSGSVEDIDGGNDMELQPCNTICSIFKQSMVSVEKKVNTAYRKFWGANVRPP
jgi:hypothetical protein